MTLAASDKASTTPARETLPDLIFVSLENWDDIWRRNQFVCAELARRFPDTKILFVGLDRNVSRELRRGRVAALRAPGTWTVPEFPNITVLHPLKWAPNSLGAGRAVNQVSARAEIRRAARRAGLRPQPVLWINQHAAGHLAGHLGERAVVYDITDDWTLASFSPGESQLIRQQDEYLCRRADLTIVCSQALEASRRERCRRLLLLPNGVDFEHYQPQSPFALSDADVPRWAGPVFGYTGTLHPDRIDTDVVLALARRFPQGTVALIGPNHLGAAADALRAQPNIVLHGPVPYARIPRFMARFDVCIVPHKESVFTESLNPLKLWEYLAWGSPIVSTSVAGFRDYPALCRIASGPEQFAEACRQALSEGDALKPRRQAEAAHHSWTARVDCLLDTLRQMGAV